MSGLKPVIFTIGDEKYGIEINLVDGIEKQKKVTPIPNGPGCIRGIMNLRGAILPVYSLRKKFNFHVLYEAESNIIITKTNALTVAIEVDEVKDIFEVDADMVTEVPPIVFNEETKYLQSIVKVGEELVVVIDPDKLMSLEEQGDVKNFMENQ